MTDNKNFILAIVLSGLIIFGWQYFYAGPQLEQQRQQLELQQKQQQQQQAQAPAPAVQQPGVAPQAGAPAAAAVQPRDVVIGSSPRVTLETPSLKGSINLKGGVLDDLHLTRYRETVNRNSPTITLLSPSGSEHAYFAEHGWTATAGGTVKLPTAETVWTVPEGATLTPSTPVTLAWDNGEGQIFRKTFAVDDNYMFTVTQEIENRGPAPISLFPYGRILRVGQPATSGNYLLHEGLLGVLNEELQEWHYSDVKEDGPTVTFASTGGWVGITDKYWATALVPGQGSAVDGSFRYQQASDSYQADYLAKDAVTVPAGGTGRAEDHLFAGAKVVKLIDGYRDALQITKFDLMIDWGWFYFLTKPMFWFLETIFSIVGNFGLAILIVTVLVKLVFFPLANKSYESMSKMKKLQPEMERLKQLFPDDRMKQQQELMEVYKREKISPISGCLPIVVQIPVFFALYKVLFGTIEMRHAPFYGWIQDLSAPDPTSLFNLFGLLPFQPPALLMIGVWPLIMGVTMWLQMRLNPTPPDPIQATMFNWMPVIFTFMLASFPAGLVIYWAWNNGLSILQQSVIMKRQGVEIDFLGNVRNSLPFLKRPSGGPPA
jgi:YidC/Oxa1 family membrane protein insertase